MRGFVLSLTILFLATVAVAQAPKESLKEHPTLKIVSFQWMAAGGTSYPGWDNTAGDGSIFPNTSNWGVAETRWNGSITPRGRTPFTCFASISLTNSGSKAIRAVQLDYVFRDTGGTEFLRYQFRANESIEPRKTTTLTQRVYQKMGKHRKAFLPLKPSLAKVLQTKEASTIVLIRRIEYRDGTVEQY